MKLGTFDEIVKIIEAVGEAVAPVENENGDVIFDRANLEVFFDPDTGHWRFYKDAGALEFDIHVRPKKLNVLDHVEAPSNGKERHERNDPSQHN